MQEHINHIESEIIDQFLMDDNKRPWIIGFSGGKDSTMLLQLVWNAIKKIDPIVRVQRKIYIICNDTLVENPKIVDFIYRTLNLQLFRNVLPKRIFELIFNAKTRSIEWKFNKQ